VGTRPAGSPFAWASPGPATQLASGCVALGPLVLPNGSSGTPTLQFSGDATAGLYFASGEWRLRQSGADALVVKSGLPRRRVRTIALTSGSASISPDVDILLITLTGTTTLSATPQISAGYDGQIIWIVNTSSSSTCTFQDEGTLTGSGMRLASAINKAIGPRDVWGVIYSSVTGMWHQAGTVQAD
jgi:hypothetical protein